MPEQIWREVVVSRMVAVQGGYGGSAQTVESKELLFDGRVTSFIRISKNTHWLLKVCGGRTCQRGGLRRTHIIEQIRDKLCNSAGGHDDANIAVGSAVADKADPMEQLEDLGDTEDHAAKRKKPMKTKLSQQVRCVQMNEKLHQPQLRAVRALLTGKNILWVHEEDVSWLLTYISDELATGGVGPIDDADGAMDDDQGLNLDGAAVAAHSEDHPVTPVKAKNPVGKIRLDFSGAWEAVISQGPQKGSTASCKVKSITSDKCEQVSMVHKYTVNFKTATFQDKKTDARHFLELHLQGLHDAIKAE